MEKIKTILIVLLLILNICLLSIVLKKKHLDINIIQKDSIEYNIKQIDSLEYNIIKKDSVIYKIKEVYEQKIKEADNLNNDDAVKLFLELVAE